MSSANIATTRIIMRISAAPACQRLRNRVKRRRKLDWCSGSATAGSVVTRLWDFKEQCATECERRCGTGKKMNIRNVL
jgi:hypothetical protein